MDLQERLQKKALDYAKLNGYAPECVEAFHTYIKHEEGFEVQEKSNSNHEGLDKVTIKGYILTWGSAKNTDRGGDFIDQTAFDKTLKKRKHMVMLRDHESTTSNTIGYWYKFKKDDHGIKATGNLYKTQETAHLFDMVKAGAINTLSIGGVWVYEEGPKNSKKIVKGDLFETSIVSIPMNPEAMITEVIKEPSKVCDVEDVKAPDEKQSDQVEASNDPGVSESDRARALIEAREMILTRR